MATKNTEAPTIQAVLLHAARLRVEAEAIIRRDYWAQPYQPTDAAARRLAQSCAKSRELQLPPEASREQREQARAQGPADALAILTHRSLRALEEYRAEKLRSERKDERHRSFQKRQQNARERERASSTIGERIDRALRKLATVSGVTASNIQGDVVSGSKANEGVDVWVHDPAARAKRIAEEAMRKVENELEDALRRRVEMEAA